MGKHLMIAIHWYGPYSLKEAQRVAKSDYEHGLYLCIGRLKYERSLKLQYVGISENISTRLSDPNHKIRRVDYDVAIWLGEIATAEPSGKKTKVTKATLDYSEWLYVRFLQIAMNDKKRKTPPSRSVTVLNRWFRPDYTTVRKHRPHAAWPDLIDYPRYDLPTRLIWFGGKQKTISNVN